MKTFLSLLLLPAFLLFLLPGCSTKENPVTPPKTGDTEQPTVQITSPVADQSVKSDNLSVEVLASDNVAVTKIELMVDASATPSLILSQSPWKGVLSIASLADGAHTLSAKAFDAAGNASSSAAVTFRKVNSNAASILLSPGATFRYDVWDTDENNQKLDATKGMIATKISGNGGQILAGETEWVYSISDDDRDGSKDTMIIHTNATSDLYVFGFVRTVIDKFIAVASQSFPLTISNVPAASWNVIAKFNAADGQPLPIGSEWDVTPPGGVSLTVQMQGVPIPISVTLGMKGQLASNSEMIMVGSEQIRTWKTVIIATFTILGNDNEIKINAWFSDNPSGQIKFFQEGATLDLGFTTYPVRGEVQELTSYVK